jgi:hypothetical protein
MQRGAQPGNQNAAKPTRYFTEAIKRAVLANDGQKMREITDVLVEQAAAGDIASAQLVIERIDGKVKQIVVHEGDDEAPLTIHIAASSLVQKIRGMLERTTELTVIEGDKK